MTRSRIGTFLVLADFEVRETYETAAWSRTITIPAGEYPVTLGSGDGYWVLAKLTGTIKQDYFQPLFAGNAIGKPYDIHQNAGQPASHTIQMDRYDAARTVQRGTIVLAEDSEWQVLDLGSTYASGDPMVRLERIAGKIEAMVLQDAGGTFVEFYDPETERESRWYGPLAECQRLAAAGRLPRGNCWYAPRGEGHYVDAATQTGMYD